MTVGMTGGIPGFGSGNTPSGNENNYLNQAAALGLNLDGFYDVDKDGNKVLNMAKLLEAIKAAESKKNGETAEAAGQADTFSKTTTVVNGTKTETEQAKTEQEKIDEEYTKAFIEYYQTLNTTAAASEEDQKAARAWAEVKDMQFDLTKTGVTNATVIAGASDFITKLETAIDATTTAIEANGNETEVETTFSMDTQADIENSKNDVEVYAEDAESDFFANNPFFKSAYDTTIFDEEEIAA